MDDIRSSGTHAVYRWTLEGHNTGPEGTGSYAQEKFNPSLFDGMVRKGGGGSVGNAFMDS